MHAIISSRALVLTGMVIARIAAAGTNSSPEYMRWFDLPKAHLRTEDEKPPSAAVLRPREQASSPAPVGPTLAELRTQDADPMAIANPVYRDFHLYHRWRDLELIQAARFPDPTTRFLEHTFQPEEFHPGRKVTLSASILTAIKRKNPLCLLNPTFFDLSW